MRAKLFSGMGRWGVGSGAQLGTAGRMEAGFASIHPSPAGGARCPGRWGTRRDNLMSGRRRKLRVGLAALLTVCLAVVVAACGSDSGGGGGSGSEKKITGAKVIDPASMDSPPKGTIHYCQGKDTNGSAHENVALLQQEVREPGLQGRADRVPGLRRPAARAVHPAPAGQVRRLRRLLLRRDLDGGVREPEVAVRHDAVRREGEGQVHRRAARDRALRRQVLGRPGLQRRRVHLLPHRQGQRKAAGHVAGGLRRRQEDRRHRLPGRARTRA